MVTRARPLPAACAALALVLLPAASRGEESLAVLPVAEGEGPGPELSARAGDLRAALSTRTPGVLGAGALRDRMTRVAPPAALVGLDHAFAGALAAHLSGDYDGANRTLRSVVESLERLPAGPEVFADWSRAVLRLARSEQELGRAAAAQALLARLLRVAPDARAEPRQYPPSFQALLEQARAELRALGIRRLTVEADPQARVLLEGRDVGAAPVALELPPGRYRVGAIRMGLRAPPVVVDLAEDRTVRLDLGAADALRPDAGPGLALDGAGRAERALGAAALLGLDRLVLVSTVVDREAPESPELLDATLLDVGRRAVVREGRVPAGPEGRIPPEAMDALAAFLGSGAASPPVEVVRPPALALGPDGAARALASPPAPAAAPRPSRAAGWAALGTGAAAVTAGVVAVVLARDAQSSYDAARGMRDDLLGLRPPHTVAEYDAKLDRGDRQRRLAIGTGVAAGACAATSAVLAWWSWRTTGEVGPFRF